MSERKVLNKYYPPDFDPTQIPKLKGPKNRTFTIRIMAPFNMRCGTCGEYIYKGKKFNSRKETVEDETYLGLYIFRFYIKCPRCVAEISFKTDPENTDYTLEAGATRNFEAARTAAELDKKEIQMIEEEEANNPMKVLENRTKQSRTEMERIEQLEELRELNARHSKVDHEQMVALHQAYDNMLEILQDEEDEKLVKSIFGEKAEDGYVKRLHDSSDSDDEKPKIKVGRKEKPTDFLTEESSKPSVVSAPKSWEKSVGSLSKKSNLKGLIVKKKSTKKEINNIETGTSNTSPTGNVLSKTSNTSPSLDTGTANTSSTVPSTKTGALGLLGSYSDSDSNQSE